ncbi:MAG: nitrophenyl compound nitroreductase subunit ArsF family protein [Prevotellaceae bacterium]|nr:nitrophenyl compound nitroreductase subunit ArsF family protein [Prevotella sp.]MDD7529740.1 nitrophenyl compound nitroreductase subunit ArsF family protein [Prevotellaceae bacterium]MDY2632984.1 nitrophenyl compound nitroreductase subunit ArsF family protein [Prevotella sp.]
MKKGLTILLMTILVWFVGKNVFAVGSEGQPVKTKDRVEVIYFHGKQRCVTCEAIEKQTKEVVGKQFGSRLKQGRVVLRVIDFSDRKNRNIAKKYRVSWSSLFIVSHKNGQETVENLTEFAFANARTSPEKFKAGVAAAINRALK